MSKLAVNLIRLTDDYPYKLVNAGLQAAGYEISRNTNSSPDLVTTWTPWRGTMADKYGSKHHDRWLVFENGYIPEIDGVKHYSIGLGGYNGNEISAPDLGRRLNIPKKELYYNSDGPILVIGQFGHKDTRYSMPIHWPSEIVKRIRLYTDRPIIYRPKTQHRKVRVPSTDEADVVVDGSTPLDDQLDICYSVVTWNSPSISVKSILAGIPTFIEAPNCVSKKWSSGDIVDIERPIIPERESLIRRISNSLWSIYEIRNGKPFLELM